MKKHSCATAPSVVAPSGAIPLRCPA
jgi:hypothetical protein